MSSAADNPLSGFETGILRLIANRRLTAKQRKATSADEPYTQTRYMTYGELRHWLNVAVIAGEALDIGQAKRKGNDVKNPIYDPSDTNDANLTSAINKLVETGLLREGSANGNAHPLAHTCYYITREGAEAIQDQRVIDAFTHSHSSVDVYRELTTLWQKPPPPSAPYLSAPYIHSDSRRPPRKPLVPILSPASREANAVLGPFGGTKRDWWKVAGGSPVVTDGSGSGTPVHNPQTALGGTLEPNSPEAGAVGDEAKETPDKGKKPTR